MSEYLGIQERQKLDLLRKLYADDELVESRAKLMDRLDQMETMLTDG